MDRNMSAIAAMSLSQAEGRIVTQEYSAAKADELNENCSGGEDYDLGDRIVHEFWGGDEPAAIEEGAEPRGEWRVRLIERREEEVV